MIIHLIDKNKNIINLPISSNDSVLILKKNIAKNLCTDYSNINVYKCINLDISDYLLEKQILKNSDLVKSYLIKKKEKKYLGFIVNKCNLNLKKQLNILETNTQKSSIKAYNWRDNNSSRPKVKSSIKAYNWRDNDSSRPKVKSSIKAYNWRDNDSPRPQSSIKAYNWENKSTTFRSRGFNAGDFVSPHKWGR